MSNEITIQVNGETHSCLFQTSLPDLLQKLGFNPRLVAVEYNGEIFTPPVLDGYKSATRRSLRSGNYCWWWLSLFQPQGFSAYFGINLFEVAK